MRANLDAMSDFADSIESTAVSLQECRNIANRVMNMISDSNMSGEYETRLVNLIKMFDDQILTAEKNASAINRICEIYQDGEQRVIGTLEGCKVVKPSFTGRIFIKSNADVRWVIR